MTNSRRANVEINYQGIDISQDLAPFLNSFTYSDNEGCADDIQITLQDRDKKWQGPWLPGKGDIITAQIVTQHWRNENKIEKLNCGKFYVDDVDFKGPPDVITIKAMSIPFKNGGKGAKHTRSWENVGLATIASDIATSAGLELLYDAPNFIYDRVDQVKQTDLAFIKERAKKEGISTKVSNEKLVLYLESKYENQNTIITLKRGTSDVLSYSFKDTAAEEQYREVELTYFDDSKKKTLKYVYTVPGIDEGPTLKINKRAKNLDEAMRWAKAEARQKNKGAKTGKLTIKGAINCVQGVTVNILNFGRFDGKYFIESSSHKIGSGYTTDISIREVLGY